MFKGIIVLNLGGDIANDYSKLIRKQNVFARVLFAGSATIDTIKEANPQGIVICGNVSRKEEYSLDKQIFALGVPILGVADGMLAMVSTFGGTIEPSNTKAHSEEISVKSSVLLKGLPDKIKVFNDPAGKAADLPEGFVSVANSESLQNSVIENKDKNFFGCSFQISSGESKHFDKILSSFLFDVCNCQKDWNVENFINSSVKEIKNIIGNGSVLLGLSGGVDSAVAAALLYKAIGSRLHCVFVDHGFMRKGESELVKQIFTEFFPVSLTCVDARQRFMDKLIGVDDPEKKRKIIGAEFLEVFKEESKKIGKLDYFAQGTIYPDIIESGAAGAGKLVKSHHNVGGLPKELGFTSLIEPLKYLYKHEVRKVGSALGLPNEFVLRQPFPGPGIAVRCLGALTKERVNLVRESDAILREEVKKANLQQFADQYFTVLPGIKSVGVKNGQRVLFEAIAIRAVKTVDFMTADWVCYPEELLRTVSNRILNEVPGVNRVLLDISPKPPASIEWE